MGNKFGRKFYQIAIAKECHLRTQKLLETSSTESSDQTESRCQKMSTDLANDAHFFTVSKRDAYREKYHFKICLQTIIAVNRKQIETNNH